MPTLEVSIILNGQLNDDRDVSRKVKQPMSKDDWLEVHQDQVGTI